MEKEKIKVDRRVQRTKRLLWDALVELILEKGYDKVTIKDIIDEADVGRSTFYAHFENKEQLLFSDQPHFFEEIREGIESGDGLNFRLIFNHVLENRFVAKALLGVNSGQMIKEHIKELISYQLQSSFKRKNKPSSQEERLKQDLFIEAAASAIVGMISCWIENNMPLNSNNMVVLCEEIVERMSRKCY